MTRETRYMNPDAWIINNVVAFKLVKEVGEPPLLMPHNETGDIPVQFGTKIYKVILNGTKTLLSGDTPVATVQRTTDGEGYQENTWACPRTTIDTTDAIYVEIWRKFGNLNWELHENCTYITEQLKANELLNAYWKIRYYTKRAYESGLNRTYGWYGYGGSQYLSRIENFAYTDPKPDPPPLNLIETAITESKTYRQEFEQSNLGITEPLTPQARRETLYLRIRESINRGCREAVKLIPQTQKRSIAYSILMKALYDAFHYKKTPELTAYYNNLLDEMVGTH